MAFKTFKQYLMESERPYGYRIRITGEKDDKFLDLFKHNLSKFNPVEINGPVRVPITHGETPEYDYSYVFDCKFRYPCTEPMVKQVARLLNCDENCVTMVQSDYDDRLQQEKENIEKTKEKSPILMSDEGEASEAVKKATAAYGDSYLMDILKQTIDRAESNEEMLERKREEKAGVKNALKSNRSYKNYMRDREANLKSMNNKSPMTKINLPPRPATAATTRRQK
jgi:hypothetical protein